MSAQVSKRSELEGGLEEAAEVVELVVAVVLTIATEWTALTIGQIAIRTAEVVDRRSHRDVVGDLELVPPLPGVVAVCNEVRLTIEVVAVGDVGHEGGLTNGHTQGVALQEGISPLKTHVPRLGGCRTEHESVVAVSDAVVAPTSTDAGEPTGFFWGPPSTQANGGIISVAGERIRQWSAVTCVEGSSVLGGVVVGSCNTPIFRSVSNLNGSVGTSTIGSDAACTITSAIKKTFRCIPRV